MGEGDSMYADANSGHKTALLLVFHMKQATTRSIFSASFEGPKINL